MSLPAPPASHLRAINNLASGGIGAQQELRALAGSRYNAST
eukprot:CAMPEP_0181337236 /NCGR_PEP_ID=MMETSP1101-20121128/27896_1 /TAXON_ID=46948 /ORGANISM="Rhodomonas abbreviata, Strain Caron Lab Isolate" /LENGTH=40 /DNA_ID= /DNA_START= /DNA_END= /DNA_ORIENTATION=